MNVYVVISERGCCASHTEVTILGVFTGIGLANEFLKSSTVYGSHVQFTKLNQRIDLGDKFAGHVSVSIIQRLLGKDEDIEKYKLMLRMTMDLLCNSHDVEGDIEAKVIQDEPDTVGLRFSFGTITLFDDGTWRLSE